MQLLLLGECTIYSANLFFWSILEFLKSIEFYWAMQVALRDIQTLNRRCISLHSLPSDQIFEFFPSEINVQKIWTQIKFA